MGNTISTETTNSQRQVSVRCCRRM